MNRNRRDGPQRDVKRERRSRSRSPRRSRIGAAVGSNNGNSSSNNRMVFITNIAYEARWVDLKSLVREKGGEVAFCELLEDRNGKPKGNAVVEFETREGAEKCVENLQKFDWKGRTIIAKEIRDPNAFFRTIKTETGIDYLSRTGGGGAGGRGPPPKDLDRPTRTGTYDLFGLNMEFLRQHNIEPPLCERIFIANLAFNVGTDKLYEVFGMAGKITWMDFRIDKEGKSKGVCVIQYTHPIEAVQAVSMLNGQRLFDRNLVVKMDRFDKELEHKEGGLPRGLESIGMGLGAEGAPLSNVHGMFPGDASVPFTAPAAPFVGGPQVVSAGGFGGVVEQANFARSVMNNGPFGGNAGVGGAGGATFAQPDVFGVNGAGGLAGAATPQATRVIIIRNLPSDYTWQIVRDRVRNFGEVDSVDMMAPGAARIRFATFQDAERARAALYGSTVEGRMISVDYA
ncbi:RRM domain-containing protein [Caenorhabditis elegans]|uniref:RRM domain-containing protein n=1 Tax=Caenorhabditis elegans TaxID=6239 RepID=Q9XVS2_CAEEL|nr:RRM domain-containing protein [Caenorhabditis elegans]CAB02757.1 RRM domain-containing protein [Caenorhabditis elegans]|eukprot:NP_492677.1 SUPpressor [Caenorhabditis elegans]